MKIVGYTVLFIVLLFLCSFVGSMLGIINLPFLRLNSIVRFNQGVIEKTYSTDYCLANYEWFKDRIEGIKGMQEKIDLQRRALKDFQNSAGARSTWTFEDKQTESDLRNKVTGLENIRVTMINEYNSRSEQLNRVACKDLPLIFSL